MRHVTAGKVREVEEQKADKGSEIFAWGEEGKDKNVSRMQDTRGVTVLAIPSFPLQMQPNTYV